MCTNNMESVVNPHESAADTSGLNNPDWLNKYIESENLFLDYLKSLTFASMNENIPLKSMIPEEYNGVESGFEALDNLCDLLLTLCDNSWNKSSVDDDIAVQNFSEEKCKKLDMGSKRMLKNSSIQHSKEFQIKAANRGRSQSNAGVNELLNTQYLVDVGPNELIRKSRRVSLGMRPKFSNWSKVKGAFKRDKSNSRINSKNEDYIDLSCYSGDESLEKIEPLPNYENTYQLSSSEEEYEYYTDGFSAETGISFQADDENLLTPVSFEFPENAAENPLLKPKPLSLTNQNDNVKFSSSNNINNGDNPQVKNSFKRCRTKSMIPMNIENDLQDITSNPSSPYCDTKFIYDEDSIMKMNETLGDGNSSNDDILQEVQNKYESLQKRISREFYEKYHEWRRTHDCSNDDEDRWLMDFHDPKLSPYLNDKSLSVNFKQKFQEWQKLKNLTPIRNKLKSENSNMLKKSKSDWHKWRPGSKSESNVLRFLDKEQSSNIEALHFSGDSEDMSLPLSMRNSKKQSSGDIFKTKTPIEKKELVWLEKELQKVAREKERLEKEKEKYAERETRLQNMKRAIKSGRKSKQEVLVPTSTGLFRFQGISSKFTRKLYEWEKAKGITAESSTFALLDPCYNASGIQSKQTSDLTSLSRSRSVGSVDVAVMSQSATLSRQQSSLSLNDMEQLEETCLQVENNKLVNSNLLYGNQDSKNINLLTKVSLDVLEQNKNNIPFSTSTLNSNKSTRDNSENFSTECKEGNKKGELLDSFNSDIDNVFYSFPDDTKTEVSSNLERRDTTNSDAENIVNQIKKLRAGTSVDDEDRINVLTNLQLLADQLLVMVNDMNNIKSENVDELATNIATLAVELKRQIKNLTPDELQTKFSTNEKSSIKKSSNDNFPDDFTYVADEYTDVEDNDSPTVHCTFTLPSWRVKHTTPSSTESESSHKRNKKYMEARQSKNDRWKHYEDNSSGGDENYDGGDETTVYLDLKCIKNKDHLESSDNISTSNSESIISSETKDIYRKSLSVSPNPTENNKMQEVLHCSLMLDRRNSNQLLLPEKYYNEEKFKDIIDSNELVNNLKLQEDPLENYEECENENQIIKMETRSYSPKLITSKRKCTACGKIKRVTKSRKTVSNNYCLCGKKELKPENIITINCPVSLEKQVFNQHEQDLHDAEIKKESIPTAKESDRKMGPIFRSKLYDFNALKNFSVDDGNIKLNMSKATNPVNVIVPTTRRIFAPLRQEKNGSTSAVVSYTVDEQHEKEKIFNSEVKTLTPPVTLDLRSKSVSPALRKKCANTFTNNFEHPNFERPEKKSSLLDLQCDIKKLPPASPIPVRRLSTNNKETNSAIKQKIAHYNKLLVEKPERRASEGNCSSSIAHNSPTIECTSRFHFVDNNDTNIRKSKSAVLATNGDENYEVKHENFENNFDFIMKSSSAGSICYKSVEELRNPVLSVQNLSSKNTENSSRILPTNINPYSVTAIEKPNDVIQLPLEKNSSFENILSETRLRNLKLQEAKNKFFNEYPSKVTIEYLPKCEKPQSQQSQANESSIPLRTCIETEKKRESTPEIQSSFSLPLNKSVSTGAIDDRIRTNHLPVEKSYSKSSKFGFSSIASKFRKVKMRRHKDPEMSAVSSLCKASLLINLDKDGRKQREYIHSSKSCPSSPIVRRNISKRNSSSN